MKIEERAKRLIEFCKKKLPKAQTPAVSAFMADAMAIADAYLALHREDDGELRKAFDAVGYDAAGNVVLQCMCCSSSFVVDAGDYASGRYDIKLRHLIRGLGGEA